MNKNISETIVSLVLIALLILIWNPYGIWMPDMMHMTALAVLAAVFGLFAGLVFKEDVSDERDSVHRMLAGRAGFLTGSIILVVAIIYQSYGGSVDIWLPISLIAMILAKIGARFYSERNL